MQRCFVAIVALSCVLASGCTTSTTLKDASTKHASNLTGLQQAVAEYRKNLDDNFDRLVQQQREAHIAWHVNQEINGVALRQAKSIDIEKNAESVASYMAEKPHTQEPAKDFIEAGASIADAFVFWRDNFDLWVDKIPGKDLAERREALKRQAAKFEEAGDVKGARKLRDAASVSDDSLTFVHVAIQLKQQRANLDKELDVLAAQVTTMQAFHAKIDEFLAIDATIDGAKIAAASAAGSKADVAGILGKE